VVSAADGQWLMQEPLQCILKPGGHGVIWKLASDEKVFDWFQDKGRKAAIVRQIRWGALLLFLAPYEAIFNVLWVMCGALKYEELHNACIYGPPFPVDVQLLRSGC
jgi:hypothetical protein